MTPRRKLLLALAACTLSAWFPAFAQRGKIPRIGYASTGAASPPSPLLEAFRQGLRDMGYFEGRNILVEYRYAEFKLDRIPSLVNELVQLNVDVLVLPTSPVAIYAALETTRTIPIVMVLNGDPVADGLVSSLARPGGNLTGLYTLQRELNGKRLELLAESISRLSRVAILWDQDSQAAAGAFKAYEAAALSLKIPLQSLTVQSSNPDFEGAFQAAVKGEASALVTITNTTTFARRKSIVELAMKHRLPSMFEGASWVEDGGLVSYSANDAEVYRRAAIYVDKILKGARPGELPIEQPTKFELAINTKTAKVIGFTIPQSLLLRADRVIE
jgi:putative tryptophan/tyrosine transport system substrate-binding protein